MADTMRIPQIKDVENATITRLKHIARDLMVKESIFSLNPMYVIRAWGIDPEDLEARLTKLRRMKLTADRQVDSNA